MVSDESIAGMDRSSKFGYGFLLMGAAIPYLIEHTFGATIALIATLVCAIAGVVFLWSGHLHREPDDPPVSLSRKIATGVLGIIVIFGACLAGLKVYANSGHSVDKAGGAASPPFAVQSPPQIQRPSSPITAPRTSKKKAKTTRKNAVVTAGGIRGSDNTSGTAIGARAGRAISEQTPSQTLNAPNGIAIGGGTVNNPTVNNYGPPPLKLTWQSQTEDPSQFSFKAKFVQLLTIKSNVMWTPVSLAIICDGEILRVMPNNGAFANLLIGIASENKDIGLVRYTSPVLAPGAPVEIFVFSDVPVNITNVVPVNIKQPQ